MFNICALEDAYQKGKLLEAMNSWTKPNNMSEIFSIKERRLLQKMAW